MSEKSVKKKNYIIERSRDVFVKRGFTSVTMKDIVQACDISRGGLYLYFGDTRELFIEVLRKERMSGGDDEIEKADTSIEMLSAFLREQKKEILGFKDSLIVALYEFYFYLDREKNLKSGDLPVEGMALLEAQGQTADANTAKKTADEKADLSEVLDDRQRFEMGAKVLEKLIKGGIDEGYLYCDDPRREAMNIMFALEGMKICSVTVGTDEEEVTAEINYLFSHLFIRENEEADDADMPAMPQEDDSFDSEPEEDGFDYEAEAEDYDEVKDFDEAEDDEDEYEYDDENDDLYGEPKRFSAPAHERDDDLGFDHDDGISFDLEDVLVAQTMKQLSKEDR